MSDPALGRAWLAIAGAGAVLSVMFMARGIWHNNPLWRAPLVVLGWIGLEVCVLVTLNILSVGGPG